MDSTAGASVAGSFVLCHILPSAPLFMIAFAIIAGSAGVPDGHIVPTQEVIVMVVVPFDGVGRQCAASCSGGGRGWRDAGNSHWRRGSWWCVVVAISSLSTAATPIVALVHVC